jgi:hypothetical protein
MSTNQQINKKGSARISFQIFRTTIFTARREIVTMSGRDFFKTQQGREGRESDSASQFTFHLQLQLLIAFSLLYILDAAIYSRFSLGLSMAESRC